MMQRLDSARVAPKRVLVVDDDDDFADVLRELLEMDGYEVGVAHDGPAALRVVTSFIPQVALLDIGLPHMDGYQLAGALLRVLRPPPRVIALSGDDTVSSRGPSTIATFELYLVKPVAFEDLRAAIAGELVNG